MATHSSNLAWKTPRTEEPGRLQSTGVTKSRHTHTALENVIPTLHLRTNTNHFFFSSSLLPWPLFFSLDKPSNAHVTPEETLQRHCEGWAEKQRKESWTVPWSQGLETPPPTDALGWPSPSCSSAILGRGGACKTCKRGALSHKILPGKKRRRPKWIWDYIESRIFLKSFISKGREKKKNDFKKSNTWTRLLYSRGRQEYPQCVTYAARAAHSLAKILKKRASLLLKKYCVSCEVDLFTY